MEALGKAAARPAVFPKTPERRMLMQAIEIARQLAALGQTEGAIKAYGLVIHNSAGADPAGELEAALYILQNGGDYRVSFSTLVDLHRRGQFREDCLSVMTHAFYEPNVRLLKTRYLNNCKLLSKYPYLFRKDFPDFEFLPVRFYPFDDNQFIPYHVQEERFGGFADLKKPQITRNFFKDLENPILAKDVFSQYELEYLNDNVRRSEWVGRENHIYLHYSDWGEFCSWLQVLNLRPLLEGKKIVFLIGDEVERYPIDFAAEYGLDYSQNPVRPVGIREVNRMIWHTQLSSHNGGDFFNEIFDVHPNLLMISSLMFDNVTETIQKVLEFVDAAPTARAAIQQAPDWDPRLMEELFLLRDRTEKDVLVAFFLNEAMVYEKKHQPYLDRGARIAPVLFFQPHFSNMIYSLYVNHDGRAMLDSEQYESVRTSPLFRNFKYIKTFTPLRRFTTSHGGTVKFMWNQIKKSRDSDGEKKGVLFPDVISQRVLNRSFMIDWQDRLYADSVLVRFEDGKLNPKATFTALAAFLDLPYCETMTYCSMDGEIDPIEMEGNVQGFDTVSVYRTYDEFANDAERTYIEYFLRDAYAYYGYDFQYYDGGPMDENRLEELIQNFTVLDGFIGEAIRNAIELNGVQASDGSTVTEEEQGQIAEQMVEQKRKETNENRLKNARTLMRGLNFINKRGQPLHMMPKLQLDPALLEQPLYH